MTKHNAGYKGGMVTVGVGNGLLLNRETLRLGWVGLKFEFRAELHLAGQSSS